MDLDAFKMLVETFFCLFLMALAILGSVHVRYYWEPEAKEDPWFPWLVGPPWLKKSFVILISVGAVGAVVAVVGLAVLS